MVLSWQELRRARQLVASWLVTLGFAVVITIVTVVTLGRWSHRLSPLLLRSWGRIMLRIAGVTLHVEGAEHLASGTMKIATFNHGSMLDAFLVTAIMPAGGVAAIKSQVRWYPLVNLALYLLGFVFIDRGNGARARRAMAGAARRMARRGLTVFIAPEGTRTPDGQLQRFKTGAFHLALATRAPIVPVVIDGTFALHPTGRYTTTPGQVRIRVLPPRRSDGFTPATLPAERAALYQVYADELARMRAEPTPERPAPRPVAAGRRRPSLLPWPRFLG